MAHLKEKLVSLARRLLNHNLNGTTDQADEIMIKPVSDYIDKSLIKSEVNKIFYDHPVPIALSAELKENNSYKATKAIDTPVLVTRDKDGIVRAFINICKHRGAPVCTEGSGNKSRFSCTYHGWMYDNKGQLINIFTDDGTRLNALITYPHNFDPMKQYPVILYNYGGPGSQLVLNRWGSGSHIFHQFFASRDFIIFSFDNRGTGGRGKAFKDLAYGDYGKYLIKDHIAAAKYLQGLTYVDAENIGIWGWSGGGYLTNMCMTLASDYYKAGISIAPNVEPLLYDTIWTERYMGLVEENPEGYKNASVLTHVDKAKGHLLQIHGNADDNVHHQHSIKLAKAYAEHGKDMEMFIYSNANHGMYNNNFLSEDNPADGWKNRYHLYKKMTDFFMEHLVPDNF